jgi:hypothetical protein
MINTIGPSFQTMPPELQFSLGEEEENYFEISETSLEVHSWRKPCIGFCVSTGMAFHPLSRKSLTILLPVTPFWMCKTGSYVRRGSHILLTNPGMKHILYCMSVFLINCIE